MTCRASSINLKESNSVTMNDRSFKSILNFYDKRVKKYGHNPLSCDYGRAKSQEIKFSVIADCADFSTVLLDVGCGFGDFSTYLESKHSNVKYSGIDLSREMIREAKLAHPNLNLRVSNMLTLPIEEKYDYITANGIFYLLGEDAPSLIKVDI